jgi:hypothetical protein
MDIEAILSNDAMFPVLGGACASQCLRVSCCGELMLVS